MKIKTSIKFVSLLLGIINTSYHPLVTAEPSDAAVFVAAPLYISKSEYLPVAYDSNFKLIPRYDVAANQFQQYLQQCSNLTVSTEFNGFPVSVSVSKASVLNLVYDVARYARNAYRDVDMLPNTATAHQCAAWCIEKYNLTYPKDNSEQSYFTTFNAQVRAKILQDYELYTKPGFIKFIQSFPEFNQHVIDCSIDRNNLRIYLNDTLQLSDAKQNRIIENIVSLAQHAKEKINQEFLLKQAERKARMEMVREREAEKLALLNQNDQEKALVKEVVAAPSYIHERIDAVETFLAGQDAVTIEKQVPLDFKTTALLIEHGIPVELFDRCTGNQMQQQLHKELLGIIKEVSSIQHKTKAKELILDGVAVGQELNHAGYVSQGYSIANMCHGLLEYTKGLAEGASHAIVRWGHAIMHPVDTIHKVGKGIYDLGQAIRNVTAIYSRYLDDVYEISQLSQTNRKLAIERTLQSADKYQHLLTSLEKVCKQYSNSLANMDKRELGQFVGDTAMDIYLFNRAISIAAKVSKFAKLEVFEAYTKAKTALTAEEVAAATVEGLEVKVAQEAAQVSRQAVEATIAHPEIVQVFDITRFEASIGNLQKVQDGLHLLEKIPGHKELIKILENTGLKGNSAGIATARGAMYELETAIDLINKGEEVIHLGRKVACIDEVTRETIKIIDVDIETIGKFIECKNYFWEKVPSDAIRRLEKQLQRLQKAASQNGKVLELHSKNKLPETLKAWLLQEKISFIEG